jgi:hypothetical protein
MKGQSILDGSRCPQITETMMPSRCNSFCGCATNLDMHLTEAQLDILKAWAQRTPQVDQVCPPLN